MNNTFESNMFAEERKRSIVEYINQNAKATVLELCSRFSVSPATIRNDLNELKELGMLERTHGGAISITSVNFEMTSNEKMVKYLPEKTAIAKRAVEFIHNGDCIGLDAGTTTFELAKLLEPFENLTVVTFDLNIASYLDNNTDVRIIISGGEVRKNFHYITGDCALRMIKDLNLDTLFLAANGISSEKGVTTPNLDTALLKKTMMNNARTTVLLADSSKLNNVSFSKFADIDQLDVFITDTNADPITISEIQNKNVRTELADI